MPGVPRVVQPEELALSDFSWHSIGVICIARNRFDDFNSFVLDVVASDEVSVLKLKPRDMARVVEMTRRFGLDFDDAYQYVTAEKFGVQLVSLDKDFAKIPRGYKRPGEVMQEENG